MTESERKQKARQVLTNALRCAKKVNSSEHFKRILVQVSINARAMAMVDLVQDLEILEPSEVTAMMIQEGLIDDERLHS